MGALCSACYARRAPLGKERSLPGGPETFGLLPQTEAAGGGAAQAWPALATSHGLAGKWHAGHSLSLGGSCDAGPTTRGQA